MKCLNFWFYYSLLHSAQHSLFRGTAHGTAILWKLFNQTDETKTNRDRPITQHSVFLFKYMDYGSNVGKNLIK